MTTHLPVLPDLSGRTAIVTGSNSGIGFITARELARKGASVILACRDVPAAEAAAQQIRQDAPQASLRVARLDLADLDSVAAFAEGLDAGPIDVLVNNAGVMAPPFSKTKQGFELQIGVNHLGAYALTGRLLPRLLAAPSARIVAVASGAHRFENLDPDDLGYEKRAWSAWPAYGASKLANLLFTFELQRRLVAASARAVAVAAHPGLTATNLTRHMGASGSLVKAFAMRPEGGAAPLLVAAADLEVRGGDYWGPKGLFEAWGRPGRCGTSARAKDESLQKRLWEVSERLTGVTYAL